MIPFDIAVAIVLNPAVGGVLVFVFVLVCLIVVQLESRPVQIGKVYYIKNGTVHQANKQYSILDNDYEVTFKVGVTVR